MSSLQSALEKVGISSVEDPNFLDLPAVREDNLWDRIRNEYNLTLFELSALKNCRCVEQKSGNFRILLLFFLSQYYLFFITPIHLFPSKKHYGMK